MQLKFSNISLEKGTAFVGLFSCCEFVFHPNMVEDERQIVFKIFGVIVKNKPAKLMCNKMYIHWGKKYLKE